MLKLGMYQISNYLYIRPLIVYRFKRSWLAIYTKCSNGTHVICHSGAKCTGRMLSWTYVIQFCIAIKSQNWSHKHSSCIITITWYESGGVSKHVHLDFLVNNFFQITKNITVPLPCGPLVTGGFTSQMASDAKAFPCDDAVMINLHFSCSKFG